MVLQKSDFVIIGGGIIGLSIASGLLQKYPQKSIVILEKQSDVAMHSSGRNSGVLHAGFYYTSDSLKAKFTKDGNKFLTDYCLKNSLEINQCGKVVVANDESELKGLYELEKRGKANGVDVSLIDENEAKEIDKNIKTYKKALWSPTTSTINPSVVCKHIKDDLISKGVIFYFNEGYLKKIDDQTLMSTNHNKITFGKLINCAGLYADKIAKEYNCGKNYTIIPFKGIYLKYSGDEKTVKTNLYPVPNLKNPFLGVHYTVTVDGTVKIGPTAIPAFWRENYKSFDGFDIGEMFDILKNEANLFLKDAFGFRALAYEEIKKYNKRYFVSLASKMVEKIDKNGYNSWSKPGIRAQLLNTKTVELVQDFVVEQNENTVHILNAVSPAFTASYPFSSWVVDRYI